jgi:polyhydroxyalkanoate synthesis repressor PhaR
MPRSTRSAPSDKASTKATDSGVRVLKKYPNRRLYDSRTSAYITLPDVKAMVIRGEAFEVRDAKTSEDLTRSILLQIILEEESAGAPMFSTQALEQIIRFYGHAMQGVMGSYLEKNLQTFSEMQQRFADSSRGMVDPKAFSPELWAQFMAGQAPAMQGLVGNYLEQSKRVFVQLQEQMQRQTGAMFSGVPGMPGMPGFGRNDPSDDKP